MVQGSVLGPVLYAIYISPIFELEDMSAFADDNYTIRCNKVQETFPLTVPTFIDKR